MANIIVSKIELPPMDKMKIAGYRVEPGEPDCELCCFYLKPLCQLINCTGVYFKEVKE